MPAFHTNIKGNNKFCGPYCLSTLLGLSTDDTEMMIQSVRGNSEPVKGAYLHELRDVLYEAGFDCEYKEYPYYPNRDTFTAWEKRHRREGKYGTYIVLITGHFVTMHIGALKTTITDTYYKNITKEWKAGVKYRRSHVVGYIKVPLVPPIH